MKTTLRALFGITTLMLVAGNHATLSGGLSRLLKRRCRENLRSRTSLVRDSLVRLIGNVTSGLFTSHAGLIYENESDEELVSSVNRHLFLLEISAVVYNIKDDTNETTSISMVADELKQRTLKYMSGVYIFLVCSETAEGIIEMISNDNFARRNIVFIFLIKENRISHKFYNGLQEVMRVCVIIQRRHKVFQMFYNQAEPDGRNRLRLINWWSNRKGLFYRPLLPQQEKVYRNFRGRVLRIPVLHKPPWHFVIYNNDSIEVAGGRDDTLLQLLSSKLNFRYEYFDPPDKSQGSALVNGTMQGVLGLIWQKETELFIGDLTITFERSLATEFSFPTLADSEAFLTHAPGRLNEALALVRPFALDVWPAVIATMVLSGPILYLFSMHRNDSKHSLKTFVEYIWVTISIFLKQSLTRQYKLTRTRLIIVLLYLASTYVIGDMYSANLTSMLTRPAREKPVSNLEQLNEAMKHRGFKLLVERHSASHGVFEAGVLVKITEDEYEKLKGKKSRNVHQKESEVSEGQVQAESDYELKAMSMTSLQGAFYVVAAGSILGGMCLTLEVSYSFLRKKTQQVTPGLNRKK